MTAAVINAGPLMVFAKLNLLHLLKKLYGRVYFADAVYREVVVVGMHHGYVDASTLHQFLQQEEWQSTTVAAIPPSIQTASLDLGEQESIALAIMQRALLLIDEEAGRRVARSFGLRVRGSLGVLIDAYRRGLIDVDQLRFNFAEVERRTDIWISPSLCRRLLSETLGSDVSQLLPPVD